MMSSSHAGIVQTLVDNRDEIMGYLRRKFGSAADPQDVFQDAFLKLNAVPASTRIDNPKSYVFRVADNLALDRMRKRAVRNRHANPTLQLEPACPAPSPEHVTDYRLRLDALRKIVDELPPRQREVFLMHKFDGLSHAEIAEKLGITKSGVEKLVMKALATCRDRMGQAMER